MPARYLWCCSMRERVVGPAMRSFENDQGKANETVMRKINICEDHDHLRLFPDLSRVLKC